MKLWWVWIATETKNNCLQLFKDNKQKKKRQHEFLAKEFFEGKSFTSKYTTHGLEYESTALDQYKKYMATTGKPVKVCKSGLVVCLDSPYLGASPDSKVIDGGCSDPFGLVEIKCP